jgi:hypothetical protein
MMPMTTIWTFTMAATAATDVCRHMILPNGMMKIRYKSGVDIVKVGGQIL